MNYHKIAMKCAEEIWDSLLDHRKSYLLLNKVSSSAKRMVIEGWAKIIFEILEGEK